MERSSLGPKSHDEGGIDGDMSLKVVVEVVGSKLEKATDGKEAQQRKRMVWERSPHI